MARRTLMAPAGPFYDPADFPFVEAFERSWRRIHDEYRGIRAHLMDWYERELYGEGWKVFGLYDFPRGRPVAQNVVRCPVTAALVRELIPRHGAAGFSVLRPRTRIRPHVGYQGDFLRAHLALDVPPGDLGLRVGGVTRRWRAGEMLVFDDRLEHAAWNNTTFDRAVLIVDFIPVDRREGPDMAPTPPTRSTPAKPRRSSTRGLTR